MTGLESVFKIFDSRFARSANQIAVKSIDTGESFTYQQMKERSVQVSNYFLLDLQLKCGDIVGIISRNSIEFIDIFLSSYQTGVIVSTYNYSLKPKELFEQLEKELPAVVFYESEWEEKIKVLRGRLKETKFIVIEEKTKNSQLTSFQQGVRNQASTAKFTEKQLTRSAEDTQMLIHTGGTTGAPKAAKLSYRSVMFNSLSEILSLGIRSTDRACIILPLFHTAGWNIVTIPLLMAGGMIILTKKLDPEKIIDIFIEDQPTIGMGVQTLLEKITESTRFSALDLSHYRWLITGAAYPSKKTMAKYWDKGVKMINCYGMTEIGPNNIAPPVESMSLTEVKEKWDSCGKPMFFNQITLVNDQGEAVTKGEKGELVCSGPTIFSGYYHSDKNYTPSDKIPSGDILYEDEDGFYYIAGRKKNMIISGGENIYPSEIEEVLKSHPEIAEAYVLGIADEKWGEVGKALIVLKELSQINEIIINQWLKEQLSTIKIPKMIEIVPMIPKNSVGKYQQQRIKELYGSN